VLRKSDPTLAAIPSTDFKLGEVRDFGQAALQSQIEGVPIEDSSKASEIQRHQAVQTFEAIAKKIMKLAK
jgi:hypothetical protein